MKNLFINIKSNISNRNIFFSILAVVILSFCYIQRYRDFEGTIEAIVQFVCCIIYIIPLIFAGKKVIPYTLFINAMLILYFERYENFTSFVIVLICIFIKPKLKIVYLSLYTVFVVICLELYNDSYEIAIIHILKCFLFYVGYSLLKSYVDNLKKQTEKTEIESKKLILSPDVKKILDQIVREGRTRDDIDGFSESTVYRKLKKTVEKNCLVSIDELIIKYDDEINLTSF